MCIVIFALMINGCSSVGEGKTATDTEFFRPESDADHQPNDSGDGPGGFEGKDKNIVDSGEEAENEGGDGPGGSEGKDGNIVDSGEDTGNEEGVDRIVVDGFDGEPDIECTLADGCLSTSPCSSTWGIRSELASNNPANVGYCPYLFCTEQTAKGCVEYPRQQAGRALELSRVELTVPVEGTNPDKAWFGYTVTLAGQEHEYELSSHHDCMSFLVNALQIPGNLDFEVALKEQKTTANRDPAQTNPKVKVGDLVKLQPGWCRVQIRASDLLENGGTEQGLFQPVDRRKLGEINFLLTTGSSAETEEVLKANIMIDDVAFESCNTPPATNVEDCEMLSI